MEIYWTSWWFGNDVKDEVYRAIKNFFEEGYKISELMNILRYVFEEYEFDGILNNDSIKNLIHKEMGFLELSKVVKEIKLFIIETSDKYSLEMAG